MLRTRTTQRIGSGLATHGMRQSIRSPACARAIVLPSHFASSTTTSLTTSSIISQRLISTAFRGGMMCNNKFLVGSISSNVICRSGLKGNNSSGKRNYLTLLVENPALRNKQSKSNQVSRSPPCKTKQVLNTSSKIVQRNQTTTTTAPDQGWLLLGGLAALGIGGIALAGYLKQPAKVYGAEGVEDVNSRIRATYGYVLGGLATTAVASVYMFQYGVARRLMMMNPWLLIGTSLLGTVGTMVAMQAIPPENKIARHLAFGAFNLCMGASLSPLGYLGGPIVLKAMAGTGCVVGSLSLIAATAPNETFLWMGAPLGMGLGILVAASIGQMFFPASALLGGLTLYGGLGIFSLFVLYDTQKVKERAQHSATFDPMTQSLGVYLDTINIFVRMAQLMAMSGQNRKQR